jgi:hypothetical protein
MQNEAVNIAIRRPDGGVSIMAFLVTGRGSILPSGARWLFDGWWSRPATPEAIQREVAIVEPTALDWRILKTGEVPTDRTYRDAWTDDGKMITHDMAKAKEIHRNRIRGQRVQVFAELDGKWMRAMAQKDQKAADEIDAQRQKWRDAPADPRIAAAQTVEELKQVVL